MLHFLLVITLCVFLCLFICLETGGGKKGGKKKGGSMQTVSSQFRVCLCFRPNANNYATESSDCTSACLTLSLRNYISTNETM